MRLCFNYHRPQRQSFMAETITLEKFYSSSLGQYALRWEQNQYDKLVSDCFGYNAVQLGATGIDFLKNNESDSRWLPSRLAASDSALGNGRSRAFADAV